MLRPKLKPPVSLKPEEETQVERILQKRGVVSKFAREQVAGEDIARLRPCEWLNDEIINFYGAMILQRSEDSKENGYKGRSPILKVHYFSTFFWPKLKDEGYERGRLAKWTKKVWTQER
jgi:sentrin-specific protease 1